MLVLDSFVNGSLKTIGSDSPVLRTLKRLLADIGDTDMPANLQAINEVQSIAKYTGTVTAGTIKITITLASGLSFQTAAIVYNAAAATILAAINTAATGVVPGWTNGDIAVAGGDLTTAAVTLTFSGASVAGQNIGLTVVDGSALTGGTAGAVTVTTEGQSARLSWAVLLRLGIIGGTVPVQGSNPVGITAGYKRGQFPFGLHDDTVQALITEAAVEDGNANVSTTLNSLLGF